MLDLCKEKNEEKNNEYQFDTKVNLVKYLSYIDALKLKPFLDFTINPA